MWRGFRCLRALLRARTGGVAAGSALGTRGLRAVNPVAPPLITTVASAAQRKAGSVSTSQLRGAEEAAGAEHGQEVEMVGPEPHPCPDIGGDPSDYAASTFSIDHMVSLLRQENAKDICVIQLPPEMRYSNYFIIVSGSSARHLHAMAHYLVKMYKHLKTDSEPHVLIEGRETDNWLCIDFGNIVVHFMLPETREIYELEKLWTLRSYDDQLAQMVPESLPDDFIFGLPSEQE
ncbi:mitochondrial assembly of ribosomal large subunit protein 1 [Eublepharis macularius]|uniref:Mitochondrial assembly of ribosomal large subunit protein 1 n=1 Tax=Eublepharis macularius TaxID=481883 RepID=A0AA97JYW1_EUBMA|nr:mitochondrial assembly of ribosomal large subunit protein 1 [Eublepharis macularius]